MLARLALALLLLTAPAFADVQPDPRPLTWTKVTATITSGGTAQTIALGNGPIRGLYIGNPSTTTGESLWFEPSPDVNGAAVVGQSMEVPSAGTLYFGPGQITNNINPSIIAATTSHRYVVYVGR